MFLGFTLIYSSDLAAFFRQGFFFFFFYDAENSQQVNRPRYQAWMYACSVAQLCPTLCNSMDCSPPGSSVYGVLRQEYRSGFPFPPPGDFPSPGIEPNFLCLLHWQADSLALHHLGCGSFNLCFSQERMGSKQREWDPSIKNGIQGKKNRGLEICPQQ